MDENQKVSPSKEPAVARQSTDKNSMAEQDNEESDSDSEETSQAPGGSG